MFVGESKIISETANDKNMLSRIWNDERKYMLSASFSVEATFVSCISIWIIISVMYLSFYIHDEATIYTLSENYMDYYLRENKNIDDGDFKAYLNRHVLLCRVASITTKKKLLTYEATIKYKSDINLGFTGLIMRGMKEKNMNIEHENRNPVKEMWLLDKDIKDDSEGK